MKLCNNKRDAGIIWNQEGFTKYMCFSNIPITFLEKGKGKCKLWAYLDFNKIFNNLL